MIHMGQNWVVPRPSNSHHQVFVILLAGEPYKPSFASITGRGCNARDKYDA